jgi:hypothetical protein
MNRKARGMTTNPPFPYDRDDTSRYSLEEIAIEFILWDAIGWSDKDRCEWMMLAIAYNFEEPEWESQFQAFPGAYIDA